MLKNTNLPRVLVVEDEAEFRDGLVELLTLENFEASGVGSISEFLDWTKENQYDILILDRNLPEGDGLEILLKDQVSVNAVKVVLTCEGQTHDRISGMNADADYYLVKPFPTDELLAILHRIHRRRDAVRFAKSEYWLLDTIKWELKTPNHLEVELTKSEFSLLLCFVQKPGQVIARDDIVTKLGFNPLSYDNRRLEVMLRRLRKKVEDAGVVKFPLQTVYGVGLAFNGVLSTDS